jgi:hypothetical protein
MPRLRHFPLAIAAFLFLTMMAEAQSVGSSTVQVKVCGSLTLARPGFGVAYRGTVRNSDYRLGITIPENLTGWGAAPDAPFHGFVIFPPGEPRSCIGFDIQHRVNEEQDAEAPCPGTETMLGNRHAWMQETTGVVDGVEWTNITVRFSVRNGDHIDDGALWMASPTKELAENKPTFQKLISQIRFKGAGAVCRIRR